MAIGNIPGAVQSMIGAVTQLAGQGASGPCDNKPESGNGEEAGQKGRHPVEQIAQGVTSLVSGFLPGPKA